MLLTEQDKNAIAEAVRKAEATTSGEIAFAIAVSSGRYRHADFQAALAGMAVTAAIYLLLPVTHTIGMVLWVELVSFAILFALIPQLGFRRWFISAREMDARVQEAAFREFYSSGLYQTREANGVLIYLSLFEHRVVVLGDKGIHERMGAPHWNEVRDKIVRGIKEGKAREGICAAIEDCGKALSLHFPPRPDDINELPDQVIDRTGEMP